MSVGRMTHLNITNGKAKQPPQDMVVNISRSILGIFPTNRYFNIYFDSLNVFGSVIAVQSNKQVLLFKHTSEAIPNEGQNI
jgi:hypothetical protein